MAASCGVGSQPKQRRGGTASSGAVRDKGIL
jgi:hypothetical protein